MIFSVFCENFTRFPKNLCQIFDKYAAVLSNASESAFMLVAYEIRTLFSPNRPNALPGTTATFSFCNNPFANSSPVSPVLFTDGNA